jgi:hypothetical protein
VSDARVRLINRAKNELAKARQQLRQADIHLLVVTAAVKIHHEFGEKHPGEYGMGPSVGACEQVILYARIDVTQCQEELDFLENAVESVPTVTIVKGGSPTPNA